MKNLMLLVILATLVSCGGKTGPVGTPGAPGTDGATGPQGEAGPQGPAGNSSSLDNFFGGYNGGRPFGDNLTFKVKYTYLNNDGSSYNDGQWDNENTQNYGSHNLYLDKKSVATSSTLDGLTSAPVNENLGVIRIWTIAGAEKGATYEYVQKLNADGYFEVIKNEIPNVYGEEKWYAVNFSAFEQLHPTSFSINDVVNFVGSSTPLTVENQPGIWGIYKDTSGNYYFDTAVESSKDLESMGSKIETAEVESVKEELQSFGLSVERTEKLSKLLNSYRKISNKRALSASEKDVFTKELLGMTFDQAAKKMVENYDGLIETAADKNGTSPEAVKELVNSFLTR